MSLSAGPEDVQRPGDGRARAVRWALIVLALAAIAVFLIFALGEDDSAGPEAGEVTLSEVLEAPDAYLGQTVTVSGEVNRLDPGTGAFTIGDEVGGEQENELFVRGASPDSGALDQQSVVRVEGEVQRIDTPDQDGPLHFEDVEDDAFDEFEGEVGIAASAVEVLEP